MKLSISLPLPFWRSSINNRKRKESFSPLALYVFWLREIKGKRKLHWRAFGEKKKRK